MSLIDGAVCCKKVKVFSAFDVPYIASETAIDDDGNRVIVVSTFLKLQFNRIGGPAADDGG